MLIQLVHSVHQINCQIHHQRNQRVEHTDHSQGRVGLNGQVAVIACKANQDTQQTAAKTCANLLCKAVHCGQRTFQAVQTVKFVEICTLDNQQIRHHGSRCYTCTSQQITDNEHGHVAACKEVDGITGHSTDQTAAHQLHRTDLLQELGEDEHKGQGNNLGSGKNAHHTHISYNIREVEHVYAHVRDNIHNKRANSDDVDIGILFEQFQNVLELDLLTFRIHVNVIGLFDDEEAEHAQNSEGNRKDQHQLESKPVPIRFSALANKGTIVLPIYKTAVEEEEGLRAREEYLKLVAGAREGDEEAIEALTADDMNNYNILSKRVQTEDILSIVDTYFQPYGIECDIYNICGNVISCQKVQNSYTSEKVWKMQIEACDVFFDLCINEERLEGEPMEGSRFRGVIWLQGFVEYRREI